MLTTVFNTVDPLKRGRTGPDARLVSPAGRHLTPAPVFPPGTFLPIHSLNRTIPSFSVWSDQRHLRSNGERCRDWGRRRGQRRHHACPWRITAATRIAAGAAARTAAATPTTMAVVTTSCQSKDRQRQREQQGTKAHGRDSSLPGRYGHKGPDATVLEDRRSAGRTTKGRDGGSR